MKRRLAAWLSAIMMVLASVFTTTAVAHAEEETNLKLKNDSQKTISMAAGEKRHMKLEVLTKEGWSSGPVFTVKSDDPDSPLKITSVRVSDANNPNLTHVFLNSSIPIILEFDITVDDYAEIGTYSYYITYSSPYDDHEPEVLPGLLQMKVEVVAEKMPPQIAVVSGTEFSAKAGEEVVLKFKVRNEGEIPALNTYLSVEYDNRFMIPTYTPLNQKIGDVSAKGTKEVTVSYTITEDAPSGRVRLPIRVTYKNKNGVVFTSEEYALYLNIDGKREAEPTPLPEPATLLLNTVRQSPESPKAGEQLKVTFRLQNHGKTDVTDVKVSLTGLSSHGFEPINSEPYQYIGTIPAGTSKQVEVTVKAGKDIPEGLNSLNVQYSYTDVLDRTNTEVVALNILNVQSNRTGEETTISRPKLMISNFYTDLEEVKAGSIFDFTFELLNTNDEIAAKNIKVTVTSSSGNFSVTAGGNSFFVREILPGEIAPITINLKASAASTTSAYPINIRMEYEYEGMVSGANYSGEVVEEQVLLQVKENLRPSVENVFVGGWQTPTVMQATTMNFEFYNMGKSTLNNTYVTIEGDFMLSNGSNSYYIGNISAGMPEYIEFDVIPLIEGNATGTMVLHMEDSNGEEVIMEKTFSAFVAGEQSWEDFPNGGSEPSVPVDVLPGTEKKPLLSIWAFLGIQAAILVIVIPITRKICLSIYKRRGKDGVE